MARLANRSTGPASARSSEGEEAAEDETLMLTYGINDCEARLGLLSLRTVFRMLRPLVEGGARCA